MIKILEDAKILADDVTLKHMILMTCVIKDGYKLYPQPFLEEAFYDE